MYILGYFESHPINAVSSGYGIFKIDIFSFFDPQLDNGESWSLLLPNLAGTHLEGFTYLGLGNILLIFLSIIIFFGKKFLHINQTLTFQILRPLNLCFVLFIIWALTTNISILGIEIISINLPKYLFAILSIFSSTGRFAWPFIYFMIIVSIFFIYRSFSKKKFLFQ